MSEGFTSPLLIPEPALQVLPTLAKEIGLKEAIVLQQLHYWTLHQKPENGWIYNTIEEWQEQFPFWSPDTIKRTWAKLKERGLVEVAQPKGTDRTNFYRLVYARIPRVQIAPMVGADCPDEQGSLPSCLTTTETTQRLTSKSHPDFDKWLSDYHEVTGRTTVRGSKEARRFFNARREDFTLADLKLASRGCHSNEHLREQGLDRPETILRDSNVERYIELGKAVKAKASAPKPGEQANARRRRVLKEQEGGA